MWNVLDTLAPILLVLMLGAGLRLGGVLTDQLLRGANWLTYWVGLPCLLFMKTSQSGDALSASSMVFFINFAGVLGCIVVSISLILITRTPMWRAGTFVQAGFRGNLAYIGLPIIFFVFSNGNHAILPGEAESMAALAMAPIVVVYNVFSVIALLTSSTGLSWAGLKLMVRQTLTNPLLLACVVGLTAAMLDVSLPTFSTRTLDMLGQFPLPLALLCVGGQLASTPLHGHLLHGLLASCVKLIVAPLIGLFTAWMLGSTPQETLVAMILLTCPTAVASYVLTDMLKGDTALAAAAIVLSSILSMPAMAVILLLFG